MTLTPRETRILWLTIVIVGGSLLWAYGIAPLVDRYQRIQSDLNTAEKTYKANMLTLSEASRIEARYRQVEAQFPQDDPERLPEDAFSEDVDYAANEALPGERRTIEPVKREEIKDVKGYEFLSLTMSLNGELSNILKLLKAFDQKGFLVKTLRLYQNRGVDSPELRLEITLARIVKLEEEEPAPTGSNRFGATRSAGGRP